MNRLLSSALAVALFALITLHSDGSLAQAPQPPATTTRTSTPAQPTATGNNIGIAATAATATLVAPTVVTTTEAVLLPTPTPTLAVAGAQATEPAPQPEDPTLEGTVITNRSGLDARFFLEGATHNIAPNSARGLRLPRPTSVLNLYTCDAAISEAEAPCFWDPYLIQQDGLYDIFDAVTQAGQTKLLLREAGAPPTDQVWVQNRTGRTEAIVFRSEVVDLPATTLREFAVPVGSPAILYVRHCLALDGQSVCEWTPKALEAGTFYALVETSAPTTATGGSIVTVELQPVVGAGLQTTTAPVVPPIAGQALTTPAQLAPDQVVCRILVPVLNVRSGPGLQYQIIDKIRTEGPTSATVPVTGRNSDGQWLTVDPAISEGGWITSSASFIACDGAVGDLPLVEAPALPESVVTPAAPVVPAPVVVLTPDPVTTVPPTPADPSDTDVVQTPTEDQAQPAAPAGQGLLLLNNSFQHEIRVTIDQRYRPTAGPSEFDLQPGAATSVVVFPGSVAFTTSSPWSGLSRNASLEIAPDSAVTLWLRFERDASGSWYLLWE